MAVPAPRTWFPGDLATHTMLNTEIRNVVNFQKTRPRYWSTLSADVSIANNTWTAVTWSAISGDLHDSDDVHTGTSSTITIVTPGLYDIRFQALWAANATGRRAARIWSNTDGASLLHVGVHSSTASPDGSAYTTRTQDSSHEIGLLKYFAAGHSLKIEVWQNSGGALNLMGDLGASNVETYICVRWLAST